MKDIKEFQANFGYDSQDLTTLGSGSGVHTKRDVEVTFNIMDRNGDILFNKENIQQSSFCDGVVFDITDENGNIVEKNFQSGQSNKLLLTERTNESIFGNYKKDFGVIATVIDETSLYSPSGYISLYGNNLEISGIKTVDSNGTSDYEESLGVFFSGNLQPSGYLYTGKMYKSAGYNTSSKYTTSGEVLHEGSYYPWEGYLTWEFNPNELSGYVSYDNFSSEFSGFSNEGAWSLVIMDYSPNGSFLISSGSQDFNSPYGVYSDDMGSGYILDHIKEPAKTTSGIIKLPYLTGQVPEEEIQLQIDLLNAPEYTAYSHVDMYQYKGDSLDLDGFTFIRKISNTTEKTLYENHTEGFGLEYNQKTWLKFTPYSLIGRGEDFIVGPLTLQKDIEPAENPIASTEIKITSSKSTASIKYREKEINSVLYYGSGVLDKIFVNKDDPQNIKPIYESYSDNIPEYNSMTLDENGKWENTTFDYTFEFRKEEDFYSVESRKITIVPTGTSQDSGNFGYPLFKIIDNKLQDDSVDFGLSYLDSGIMLLCNISGNEFDIFKYYKTSI
tara:strand:- start:57 stop:1724 length:1668 start_codon:yes stop_codon:yes gene_type:complete